MIAMVLLAIWMPATLHCELETLGVFDSCEGCHEKEKPVARDDDADGCIVVEAYGYRVDSPALLAGPVDFQFAAPASLPALAPKAIGRLDATSAPLDFRREWQFVRRAALPPQAP